MNKTEARKILKEFSASLKSEMSHCKVDRESHNFCMSHEGWAELHDAIDAVLKGGPK